MKRKGPTIWIIISFAAMALSYFLRSFDLVAEISFWLYPCGFLSSLLAVGYYVTSPDTILGKFAYVGVIIMSSGIVFKVLHWTGGNAIICGGLAVFIIPFGIGLFKRGPQDLPGK